MPVKNLSLSLPFPPVPITVYSHCLKRMLLVDPSNLCFWESVLAFQWEKMHLCHGFYMNSKPPITFKRVGRRWTGSAHFLALSYECSFVGHNILRTLCHNFFVLLVMFPWLEKIQWVLIHFPLLPPKKQKVQKKSWFIFLFLPREPRRLLDGCDFLPTTDLQNLQKGHLFFDRKYYMWH